MATTEKGDGFWAGLSLPAKVGIIAGTAVGAAVVAGVVYKCTKKSSPVSPRVPPGEDVKPSTDVHGKEPNGPVKPPSNSETGESSQPPVEEKKQLSPLEKAEDWRMRGNKWFKAERYDKALQYYKEALNVCPERNTKERAVYYQNIAAAQERFAQNAKSDTDKKWYLFQVVESSTEALKLNPHYAKPYARRGRAYSLLDRDEMAIMDYTALSILDESILKLVAGDFEKVIQTLAKKRVDEIMAKRTPGTPEAISYTSVSALLNVTSQMRHLKRSGIEKIWTSWCEENHDEDLGELEDQPMMKAVTAFEQREYSTVITQCTEALETGAEFLKPYARLVNVTLLQLMHRKDEALAGITEILQLQGVPPEVKVYTYIMQGEVYTEDGSDQLALTAYENALKEDSENADIYLFRAKYYLAEGETYNPASGMEDMIKAYSLRKEDPIVLSNYAYALFKMGAVTNSMMQVEEAVDKFKMAVSQFPKSAVVFATYGHMLQEALQVNMALENFQKAVELEPDNALHHVSLCFSVLFSGGPLDDASRHAQNAILKDPFCGLGYQALASLEMQKLNVERAMELYEKACQLILSKLELAQCVASYEMAKAQVKMCEELGLKLEDVMKRAEGRFKQTVGF